VTTGGEERVQVSRATWYAGIKAGRFPRPVCLGPRPVAWHQSDIDRIVNEGVPRNFDG